MVEQKGAVPEKKGYFARRKERKEAKKQAAVSVPPARGPPVQQRPGTAAPARPGLPPKPAPPAPRPEVRYSLESIPEVERRIDRMSATERRQKLLDRYEKKFGEKLDVPSVFVSIEDEKKADAAAAADAMAPAVKAVPEDRLAAVTGMAPAPKPAAPAPRPAAPAKAGFFGARPAPPRPGPAPPAPGAPAGARHGPAPAARPPAPRAPRPALPPPKLPEGMTMGRHLWPAVWPFWGLILRRYAKFRYPENRTMITIFTVVDLPLLVILFLPRLFGLFWAGLALHLVKRQKAKKAALAQAASEEVPAATD